MLEGPARLQPPSVERRRLGPLRRLVSARRLVDEVQAHLARINGAPPGELIANALCQVGHSVTRALLKLGKYLAFGRRVARALDEHVLL